MTAPLLRASARRRVLAVVVLAGTLVAALVHTLLPAAPPGAPPAAAEAERRPNVVLVLADDMRADELRFLPAVRRLQRSGVTFTRAVSADSLCCPARATLLTGKLAHNHLTVGNSPETHGGYQVFAQHNDIENLLPQWLGSQGYRTAWIGKYLNGVGRLKHFDQPDWGYFAVPVRRIYDYRASRFSINGSFARDTGYRELFTRRLLLSRIRDWSPSPRPYFVLYSALAPHKQWTDAGGWSAPGVQRRHRGFDVHRLSVRPSVGETDLSDKPSWLQAYAAGLPHPRSYPWRRERHRVEALLSVNDTVRELVSTLRAEGELRRTVIIVSSDNGYLLHEHDLGDKNKAYEESLHVPLVVRGPGFRGGRRMDQTVSLADVTATVRRIAGVSRTHGADGRPLQAVLAHPTSFARRPVEIEGSTASYPERQRLGTDRIGRFYTGAVWGPYSLVRYETGDWEFYDRSTDPWQLDNAYTPDPAPGSAQALLQSWYAAHVDCHRAACNDRIR